MITTITDTKPDDKPPVAIAKERKLFFPNLDGLRFICFLLVFLFHAYKVLFPALQGTAAYEVVQLLFQHGELGVNFFFVLSGFLITFLLIREVEVTGTVHVGNFYVRRILRIWPLFYMCIIIGFLFWPLLKSFLGEPYVETSDPWYYIFLINNFDYIRQQSLDANLFPDALILLVLWSVAVEEQFYLTWPVILKYMPRKLFPVLFSAIIVLTIAFRLWYASGPVLSLHDVAVLKFHTLSVIGDMAVGAMMAYYCSYPSRFLAFVTKLKKPAVALIYLAALAILLFQPQLFGWSPVAIAVERLVIAFIFGMVILEQNFCERSLFKMSSLPRISKLGNYTYGLYCLHLFIIGLVATGLSKAHLQPNSLVFAIVGSALALGISIVICKLSYRYFEKPFLKLKNKFAFITK